MITDSDRRLLHICLQNYIIETYLRIRADSGRAAAALDGKHEKNRELINSRKRIDVSFLKKNYKRRQLFRICMNSSPVIVSFSSRCLASSWSLPIFSCRILSAFARAAPTKATT